MIDKAMSPRKSLRTFLQSRAFKLNYKKPFGSIKIAEKILQDQRKAVI